MTDQLTVSGLTKDFAGLRAVDDVSFTLERGDILGLIGPNGSGKTTTINLVTGLLKPTAGRVEVGGHDVTGAPAHKIAARGLARTFQAIKLFPELTVAENVEVAAVGTGMNRRDARTVAHTMLDELEVGHLAGLYANELAYGSERRVEIARALARKPDFLLLDEPAAGLNEGESDALLKTLAGIPARYGCGILIVEHDMRLMMRLCRRLHVLNYGRTIGQGTPAEIRANPAVIDAYLGTSTHTIPHAER